MDVAQFFPSLLMGLTNYFPQLLDPSSRPIDSSNCKDCRNIQFDFIVVGAGSAGCVVASRLALANPNWNILLLEAGGQENYLTEIPSLHGFTNMGATDWNYTTVPQINACGTTGGICEYPRGHVMGGSSSTNALMYVRGNREDFNKWAAMGNDGWSWNDVFPYFLKLENMTISQLQNSNYHNVNGPQPAAWANYYEAINTAYVNAAYEIGLQLHDYNAEIQTSIGYTQMTSDSVTRWSSSKSYLESIRNVGNLYIFMNTLVTRVLFNSNRAIGVTCVTNGEEYNVYATREVILSAGAINTPKLLMVSGIGPSSQLVPLNIPVIQDLPVGEILYDHPLLDFLFELSELNPCCELFSQAAIDEYIIYKRGILTANGVSMLSFLNYGNNANYPPLIQFHMGHTVQSFNPFVQIPYASLTVTVLVPTSVGWVRLNPEDPVYGDPLINPNFFSTEYDIELQLWGIRQVFRFMETQTMSVYRPQFVYQFTPMCEYLRLDRFWDFTDEYLRCFIHYNTVTVYHPVGTARMGPPTDPMAVVDSRLRVYNMSGLRVIDASIMPTITSGNTNAPTMMIGEKGVDMVIEDNK